MIHRLSEVLSQFKRNWTEELSEEKLSSFLEPLVGNCRERLLPAAKTLQVFLLQVLHGNASCTELRHLCSINFSGAAYCKARQRLPLGAVEKLAQRVSEQCNEEELNDSHWNGHRVWIVDGSSCSMPDTPELQDYFSQPCAQKDGCGFPVASLVALMDMRTGMIKKMLTAPYRTGDLPQAVSLHSELQDGDILVKDRGFCSYAHLSLLVQQNLHCVTRMHQNMKFSFAKKHVETERHGKTMNRRIKMLGKDDQLVEWTKQDRRPPWMNKEQFKKLCKKLTLREIRYRITKKGFRTRKIVLVTTLLDEKKYPKEAVIELYRRRWEIETNFRYLKTQLGMDILKCKKVDGVKKEICIFAMVYNLLRLVMLEAAKMQNVSPGRISFIDAMRWLRTTTNASSPKLIINPIRPNRFEPRVRKRRAKTYKLMTKTRAELKKTLCFQTTIA